MKAAPEELIHITGEILLYLIFPGENIEVKVQKESLSIKAYLSRKGDLFTSLHIYL